MATSSVITPPEFPLSADQFQLQIHFSDDLCTIPPPPSTSTTASSSSPAASSATASQSHSNWVTLRAESSLLTRHLLSHLLLEHIINTRGISMRSLDIEQLQIERCVSFEREGCGGAEVDGDDGKAKKSIATSDAESIIQDTDEFVAVGDDEASMLFACACFAFL